MAQPLRRERSSLLHEGGHTWAEGRSAGVHRPAASRRLSPSSQPALALLASSQVCKQASKHRLKCLGANPIVNPTAAAPDTRTGWAARRGPARMGTLTVGLRPARLWSRYCEGLETTPLR